jgi:RNA polymerase sigma-70 factor (ECF subfamily)
MNQISTICLYIVDASNKGGTTLQERELVVNVQKGDMQAFEQLFELYKCKALRTIYSMTRDKDISEDIVQEVFVSCYTSIKSLQNPEYFKTWFYRMLTRTTWRYMEKEKRLIPVENIFRKSEDSYENSSLEKLEQKESSELLYQEILKLQPKLQTTLILYYYNEFSVKEIAQTMGCLEGTVKSRLYTGRRRLKVNLMGQEEFII